jgi:tight adherence protein B
MFFVLVFVAVFLLVCAVTSEVSARRQAARDLRGILDDSDEPILEKELRILRKPRLDRLSALQRILEQRPEFDRLRALTDQAGLVLPIYLLLAYSLTLAVITFAALMIASLAWLIAIPAAVGAAIAPIILLIWIRARRISKIEMQLADAVDTVKRSLRAGNPLVSTFRLVATNMNEPIAREFGITASDLSYGSDPRSAMLAMIERVPSVLLRGFVMAILVQRETGGNLAEALDHISTVIRQRSRFDKKLQTLSAEGRLSATILIAIPFALAGALFITTPTYLARLLDDPRGPTLLAGAGILMVIGVIWIRRISHIAI